MLRHNQDAQLTRIIVIVKACATCATESATVRLQQLIEALRMCNTV